MTTRKLDPWCPAVEWLGEVFVAAPDFWPPGKLNNWLILNRGIDAMGAHIVHGSRVRPLTRAARDVLRCVRGC